MTGKTCLVILLAAPMLGGCVAQAALAAADLSRYIPESYGPSNAHLKPVATQACTARASQYGTVHILDAEQRRPDRLVIWGSVTDGTGVRRVFDCHFTTSLVDFNIHAIR